MDRLKHQNASRSRFKHPASQSLPRVLYYGASHHVRKENSQALPTEFSDMGIASSFPSVNSTMPPMDLTSIEALYALHHPHPLIAPSSSSSSSSFHVNYPAAQHSSTMITPQLHFESSPFGPLDPRQHHPSQAVMFTSTPMPHSSGPIDNNTALPMPSVVDPAPMLHASVAADVARTLPLSTMSDTASMLHASPATAFAMPSLSNPAPMVYTSDHPVLAVDDMLNPNFDMESRYQSTALDTSLEPIQGDPNLFMNGNMSGQYVFTSKSVQQDANIVPRPRHASVPDCFFHGPYEPLTPAAAPLVRSLSSTGVPETSNNVARSIGHSLFKPYPSMPSSLVQAGAFVEHGCVLSDTSQPSSCSTGPTTPVPMAITASSIGYGIHNANTNPSMTEYPFHTAIEHVSMISNGLSQGSMTEASFPVSPFHVQPVLSSNISPGLIATIPLTQQPPMEYQYTVPPLHQPQQQPIREYNVTNSVSYPSYAKPMHVQDVPQAQAAQHPSVHLSYPEASSSAASMSSSPLSSIPSSPSLLAYSTTPSSSSSRSGSGSSTPRNRKASSRQSRQHRTRIIQFPSLTRFPLTLPVSKIKDSMDVTPSSSSSPSSSSPETTTTIMTSTTAVAQDQDDGIEMFYNRTPESFRREYSDDRVKPKRPPNGFMIYRREQCGGRQPNESGSKISISSGKSWRLKTEEEKMYYRKKSEAERAKFATEHPLYKFSRGKGRDPKAKAKKQKDKETMDKEGDHEKSCSSISQAGMSSDGSCSSSCGNGSFGSNGSSSTADEDVFHILNKAAFDYVLEEEDR
ncbi:hypothetical protein B0O80DRAFT_523839 [Mortierella sp. GBAus27b]|nr:hypothetical protein B0O80DRAFT_523839 [Mortierella sp. GBAus27b]